MTVTKIPHTMTRRALLLFAAALATWPAAYAASAKAPSIQVWKNPGCGCCTSWVAHLESQGFVVTVTDQANDAARSRLGMPEKFASCHTALIDGYVVEGHVPASDILRMLEQRPPALGLAAPGMPVGAPGMNGPEYGGRQDAFQVLLVQKDGSAQTFASYP